MTPPHRRHDISDKVWSLLEGHLPGREGTWGGVARDNRQLPTAALFAGLTKVSGKSCWKF